MGVSVYLIWVKRNSHSKAKEALKLFWIQLALNFIWTPVFFGAKNLSLAFVVIVAMWIYIVKTIKAFGNINTTAAHLLYPYLAWVSFASLLNLSLWFLNR
jgi:tryptophan-rich sensory protein